MLRENLLKLYVSKVKALVNTLTKSAYVNPFGFVPILMLNISGYDT
ncbi:hypothetical protein H375_9250 [Rickettsia prowazekii str. Breinl]|nr:hypothetical protein H375_9250 [Rickettsia prowazekii str. Breinl]